MIWYLLKLAIVLPLILALAWGSLRLASRFQQRMGGVAADKTRAVRVVETVMLSPMLRIAVLEFRDREILIAISRQRVSRLAEVRAAEHGR